MPRQFRPRGVEKDGLKYYQENREPHDYLVVDPSSAQYYCEQGQHGNLEARATAISGQPSSVCTLTISEAWLKKRCKRVAKRDIPKEWLEVLE